MSDEATLDADLRSAAKTDHSQFRHNVPCNHSCDYRRLTDRQCAQAIRSCR